MDYQTGHVLTLANSIIGVSILAMPYCFKQCGIVLSTVILLASNVISRLSCHFLLKSAILSRRKTFEFLAFHIFGALGKFFIEIGIIGFLLGTCVAFFVVMGDLGPEILSEMTGFNRTNTIRTSILVVLAMFCVLPLGLLKNIDSLEGVSRATIGFYCCLVLKVIVEALPHIFVGDWINKVNLWRPVGILQCLPIFTMALFCQTQLFEIYQAVPNASLEKMNNLIRVAVNICTWVYIFVGIFGYLAFFPVNFTGNIMLSFKQSLVSDVLKMGFVLSLAFSFPLVIFPCRNSLYSLLYKKPSYSVHESSSNYIPEGKFKVLTFLIVFVSLIIGILIPNIELVLGLVGSTIGVLICVIFPATCFICVLSKNTNERLFAQFMLAVGIVVMVLGTYANLYAFEEANMAVTSPPYIKKNTIIDFNRDNNIVVTEKPKKHKEILINSPLNNEKTLDKDKTINNKENEPIVEENVKIKDKQDPVVEPQLPLEDEKLQIKDKQEPVVEPQVPVDDGKNVNVIKDDLLVKSEVKNEENIQKVDEKLLAPPTIKETNNKEVKIPKQVEDTTGVINEKPNSRLDENPRNISEKKLDEVDPEAIKKEDTELKEQEKEKKVEELLIDTIQKQNQVQMEIVKQHKKLIEVIQKQQEKEIKKAVNEEKLKAVKQIEKIALKAIESIQNQNEKETNNNNNNIKSNLSQQLKNENKQTNLTLPIPLILNNNNNNNKMETNEKDETQFNKQIRKIEEKIENVVKEVNKNELNMKDGNNNLKEKKEISIENKEQTNIQLNKEVNNSNNNDVKKETEGKKGGKELLMGKNDDVPEHKKRTKRELIKKFCEGKTTTEKPILKIICNLTEINKLSI